MSFRCCFLFIYNHPHEKKIQIFYWSLHKILTRQYVQFAVQMDLIFWGGCFFNLKLHSIFPAIGAPLYLSRHFQFNIQSRISFRGIATTAENSVLTDALHRHSRLLSIYTCGSAAGCQDVIIIFGYSPGRRVCNRHRPHLPLSCINRATPNLLAFFWIDKHSPHSHLVYYLRTTSMLVVFPNSFEIKCNYQASASRSSHAIYELQDSFVLLPSTSPTINRIESILSPGIIIYVSMSEDKEFGVLGYSRQTM